MDKPRRYRSIWLSDMHLGTRGCKAEFLLDFLRSTESDFLYLVGDIIDGWSLRRAVVDLRAERLALRGTGPQICEYASALDVASDLLQLATTEEVAQ